MSRKSEMNRDSRDRKRRVRLRLLPAMLGITIVISACGKAGSTYAETAAGAPAAVSEEIAYEDAAYDGGVITNQAVKSASYDMDMAEDAVAAEEPVSEAGSVGQDAAAPETSRKLIKTVNIYAETEDFDALVPQLQKQVETLGGYIESISVYDAGSYYLEESEVKQRCANITARVPKEKLDGFLDQVGEQTNVTSRSERVEDVTLQYVDLESHKKALLTEQERLLELMEQAESVEDIIAIEGRLSEVRYQLESMESQLRTYDNQIDYSTVELAISEVRKYSPAQTASVWQRITNGFMKSISDIGIGMQNFAIGLLIDIPYIVLWLVVIAVAAFVLRILWKVWRKRRAKRAAARGENAAVRESGIGKVSFRWPVTVKSGEKETEKQDSKEEQGK